MASKKSKLEQAAAEATKGFFSVNDKGAEDVAVSAQNGTQAATQTQTTHSKGKGTKAVQEPSEALQGTSVIFSVRADSERVAEWRAYAKAKEGASLSEIVNEAMREYIKRHPLTDAEADTYSREMRKHELLKDL